jgi:hypothetical protein
MPKKITSNFHGVKWNMLLVFSVISIASSGQVFSPYYTNATYQKYLNYLIYSGKLKIEHPLSQPYGAIELGDSLPHDEHLHDSIRQFSAHIHSFASALRADLKRRYVSPEDIKNENGNMIIGSEPGNRNNLNSKINTNDFLGSVFSTYSFRNLGLYSSVTVDEAYRRDSLYFGSTGKLENKVVSRTDESYLQWQNRNFIFFAGRINRNLGSSGFGSLILSDESFSFDHFAFTFRNKILKYTSLFGRLNDIDGFDVRDSVAKYQWSKRFLTIHRFEISISKKIEIAFTDVILFGGKDAFPQFQYLNPVNFLFMSKMSDRKGYEEGNANALMCFDLYFKPSSHLTLFGQFLIDDIDIKKSLRKIYPDRLGYSAKVIYSDLFPASQIYLSYNRISNWTYTSFYTWGNYTYYGKGLGYPQNGSENLKLGFDVFKFYPFMFGLEVLEEQYREQELNAPFIAIKTDFPIGTPQNSFSVKLNTTYIPASFISANLSTEFVAFNNYGFIKSEKQSFFNIYLTIKMQGILKLF